MHIVFGRRAAGLPFYFLGQRHNGQGLGQVIARIAFLMMGTLLKYWMGSEWLTSKSIQ